jgi:N utilization substance protein B
MAQLGKSARRRARELAFRVVYQADLTSDSCDETWRSLREAERLTDDQAQLVADVVACLGARAAEVDRALAEGAEHWSLQRLAATDRAVLRLATAELMSRPGTPARVVLDEAIEIARRFGSAASGSFVNGVLDRVARQLRPGEL